MIADIKTIQELGHTITGIIHVGSNDGEEVPYYLERGIKNIALFEPLQQAFLKAVEWSKSAKSDEKITAMPFGWAERSDVYQIQITENDKASSVMDRVDCDDPEKHPVFKDWNMGQWPIIGEEAISLVRYDEFVKATSWPTELFDCLVMDVQGMEMQALKGMGEELKNFKYLIIELSAEPVYKGEAPAEEVCRWLCGKGFERKTPILPHDNVLFIREREEGCR